MERSNCYEHLSQDMKIRYDEKFEKCGGIDPYTIKTKDLSMDRNDFPEITLWDIGNHLIYSESPYTKKMFQAYKSTDAYRLFESGFVLNIGSKKVEKIQNLVIVKGKIKHSQRMNAPPLQAWFLAKKNGEIICAHCTCIAGLSETCSHVAALCFTVRSIKNSNESVSTTDLLCKWNIPQFSEVSMSQSKDMKWTHASYEEPTTSSGITSSFRTYCDSLSTLSDVVIIDFLNDAHADGLEPAARTILYPDEVRRISTIKDELFLANLYNENNANKSRSELAELGKSLFPQISEEDSKEIGRLTVPQLKSKISVALRRGRITGSNFHDCCITSIENPSITIINRVINPISFFDKIPSVKYQNKNKKKAVVQFERQAQTEHENFQYRECGLIINPEYPCFATFCDGLISCDCHSNGCMEVKCLKILESGEPFDVLTHKPNNILNKLHDEFYLEKNHDFFYKTQMQIHLSGSKYCDFVIWSPMQHLIIRVYADIEFWEKSKQRALNFHQHVVMPELLAKFFTGRKENNEESSDGQFQLIGLEIEPINFETK